MNDLSQKTYIICSTPRTGSSLLCSLLKSTKMAGYPESYFRKQDIKKWALQLGVIQNQDEQVDPNQFLRAVIRAGCSENGICGIRIMWGTLEDIVKSYIPALGFVADKEALTSIFGDISFIYLHREDTVAQAVSLWKALQTDVWHKHSDSEQSVQENDPTYDFEEIHKLNLEMQEHNLEWQNWFSKNNVQPFELTYETLSHDPVSATSNILSYLGVANIDRECVDASNRKLSDCISAEWVERYKSEVTGEG